MNVTIFGCGAFGTALAYMFRENNCKIKMWDRFDNNFDSLRSEFNDVFFTTDMNESFDSDSLIVIAIPIEFIDGVIKELSNYYNGQDILVSTKGINSTLGLFTSDIINKYIKCDNMGVIAGGTFAIDMKNKNIMGLTLGTKSNSLIDKVKMCLDNKYLNIQYCDDMLGVQVCSAIKNVMAIGHGILDGDSYPESSRFLFLTEAMYEIRDIIKFLGGKEETIMSYAGIDDIMMTCTSSKSRNYSLGFLIGNGDSFDNYIKENTVEGLSSIAGFKKLLGDDIKKFPICNAIYDVLYNDGNYQELVDILER